MLLHELLVQFLSPHLVEIGMPDKHRAAAALGEPFGLERQTAQHVVDEAPHLLDPPTGPGPDLRRRVIENRNTVRLGASGDPPVKAGVIDEHHRVGSVMAEVSIGPAHEVQKLVQVQQRA